MFCIFVCQYGLITVGKESNIYLRETVVSYVAKKRGSEG